MLTTQAAPEEIEYPCSDGKPMADNTVQARWMELLYNGLVALFREAADVFVAMDLLWYLVRGSNAEGTRVAPDVFVAFGRPKGDRMCWLPWEEGGVVPQVVFEIISPSNGPSEMARKFLLYEDAGVQEYYILDPEENDLQVYVRGRTGAALVRARFKESFTSPLMGVRFDITGPEVAVFGRDGRRFLDADGRAREDARKDAALVAEKRRADAAEKRASRLAELSRKARQGAASAEELVELEGLESAG